MPMVFMKAHLPTSSFFLGITLPVYKTVLCTRNVEREVITKMRERKYIGERNICGRQEIDMHEKGKKKKGRNK